MEENVTLFVDFKDKVTATIYCRRFADTAKILGLSSYNAQASEYGLGKYHLKMVISGLAKDIEMFIDFVNVSTQLSEEANFIK